MLQLHHLETSRSTRIIWLLEVLGIEYELITHKRGPDMRAGAELKAVHPLGKSPVIVDGDLVLAESSAILRYIEARYGNGQLTPPAGTNAYAKHDEWLDYAESSLMLPAMVHMLGRIAGGLPPMIDMFAASELTKHLDFLSNGLSGPYLMGDALTLADIQMSSCLGMLDAGGFLADRPKLAAYWRHLQAEPAFKRAIEIGGPLSMPIRGPAG